MPATFQDLFPVFLVLLSRRRKRRVEESVLLSTLPLPPPQRSMLTLFQAEREVRRSEREAEELASAAALAIDAAIKKPEAQRRLTDAELAKWPKLNELLNRPALQALRELIIVPAPPP